MSDDHLIEARASALRAAFVRSFAGVQQTEARVLEPMLAIRVADEPYALRLREVAEIAVDKRVVPTPTTLPAFLGLAGIRGGLVSVISLAALLGHTMREGTPRYLALCAGGARCAVAFDALDAFIEVAAEDVHVDANGASVARIEGTLRPIVDLVSLVGTLEPRARALASAGGR